MGFWTDAIISVPAPTFKKLEQVVEDLWILRADAADDEEEIYDLTRSERKELAEKLARRIIEEWVRQQFQSTTDVTRQLMKKGLRLEVNDINVLL